MRGMEGGTVQSQTWVEQSSLRGAASEDLLPGSYSASHFEGLLNQASVNSACWWHVHATATPRLSRRTSLVSTALQRHTLWVSHAA